MRKTEPSRSADLSAFYAVAATDPELSWAAAGAGRMLRSPTIFEDVVKTICTTNCAWSATVRMTSALVDYLGAEASDGRRAFPAAEAMAEAGEAFYRGVVRAGYRGAYLRSLAESVPRAGSTSRHSTTRSWATRRSPSACWPCPAAGRTRRRTS